MIKYIRSHKIQFLNSIIAILYIYIFRLVYVNYLAESHAQYAYRVENTDSFAVFLTNVIAFTPILLYRAENKISDLLAIFLYIMAYVPTMIGLQYYYNDYSFVIQYQLAFLFAITIFFLAGRNRISNQRYGNSKISIDLKYFIWFAIFDILLVITVFHSKMRFVNFYEVYELREESMDYKVDIPFFGYLFMWLNSISPLMIAIGCLYKKKKVLLLGFFIALVYYMVNAMKSVLFAAVLSYILFYFIRKWGIKYVFPLLVLPLFVSYFLLALDDDAVIHMGISIMMNRTYGISSQITPMYIDVFQHQPYTYLSHVRIINAITGLYPFGDQALGYAISEHYNGKIGQSNSNFLVTDGIASGGIIGIILISIVFYFLITYLNKVTNRFKFCFVAASMIGAITELSNLSLFTTLLSSGLLFLMFYYRFLKINYSHINERN